MNKMVKKEEKKVIEFINDIVNNEDSSIGAMRFKNHLITIEEQIEDKEESWNDDNIGYREIRTEGYIDKKEKKINSKITSIILISILIWIIIIIVLFVFFYCCLNNNIFFI